MTINANIVIISKYAFLFSEENENNVTAFIKEHVHTAYLASDNKRELHYILPINELRKGSFEKLFTALESNLSNLGISSYGIKNTTLEEVFLKVAEKKQHDGKLCNISISFFFSVYNFFLMKIRVSVYHFFLVKIMFFVCC